jgi:DNA-binding CsgD family transcriptional regulator
LRNPNLSYNGRITQPKDSVMAKRKYEAKLPPQLDRRRGPRPQNIQRNQAICARRAQGIILERIGDEFGLSGEQVRQIVLNEERRAKQGKRPAR